MPAERLPRWLIALALASGPATAGAAPPATPSPATPAARAPAAAPSTAAAAKPPLDAELAEFLGEFSADDGSFVDPFALEKVDAEIEKATKAAQAQRSREKDDGR